MKKRQICQLALVGATASGKSSLALKLAEKHNGIILSLDSLALYRKIDIASAKPPLHERKTVPHYGIDILDPDEDFDVMRFIDLYRRAKQAALDRERPLFIVGGSGFYLKVLLDGISPLPEISPSVRKEAERLLRDLPGAYAFLKKKAPIYAASVKSSDRYRIEKGLLVLLQTGLDPRSYFEQNPPVPVVSDPLPLFEIVRERPLLRKRIEQRTDRMLRTGLIDEVADLEYRYGRRPHCMKSIGISEVLAYFDGEWDYDTMREKIIIHTARLAKRQETFNRSQLRDTIRAEPPELQKRIERWLEQCPVQDSRKTRRPS